MSLNRLIVVLLPLAMLVGCASAKITSSVDKSRQYRIEKLDIYSEGPLVVLSNRYADILSEKLSAINVSNVIYVPTEETPLYQTKGTIKVEDLIKSTANANVLICSMTKVTTNLASAHRIEMSASIYNKEVSRVIWSAKIDSSNIATQGLGIEGVLLREIADKTIERLKVDGLLTK